MLKDKEIFSYITDKMSNVTFTNKDVCKILMEFSNNMNSPYIRSAKVAFYLVIEDYIILNKLHNELYSELKDKFDCKDMQYDHWVTKCIYDTFVNGFQFDDLKGETVTNIFRNFMGEPMIDFSDNRVNLLLTCGKKGYCNYKEVSRRVINR